MGEYNYESLKFNNLIRSFSREAPFLWIRP